MADKNHDQERKHPNILDILRERSRAYHGGNEVSSSGAISGERVKDIFFALLAIAEQLERIAENTER